MIDQDGAPRRDVRSVMNGLSAKERADVARHWIPAWDRDEASRGPGPCSAILPEGTGPHM